MVGLAIGGGAHLGPQERVREEEEGDGGRREIVGEAVLRLGRLVLGRGDGEAGGVDELRGARVHHCKRKPPKGLLPVAKAVPKKVVKEGSEQDKVNDRLKDNEYKEAIWDERGFGPRLQIQGDSMLVTKWATGAWRIYMNKFRKRMGDIHNLLDMRGDTHHLAPPAAGEDLARHIFREGNSRADRLTHIARNDAAWCWSSRPTATWSASAASETMHPTATVLLRGFYDGWVSAKGAAAGCALQAAENKQGVNTWETFAEAAIPLDAEATVTECEFTAFEECVKAAMEVIEQGEVQFALSGARVRRSACVKRRR